MAVIFSLSSTAYTPRTINLPFLVAANVRQLLITLTRQSWPVGVVGSAKIMWSDGSFGSANFVGGTRLDKFSATRTFERVSVSKPPGITIGKATIVVMKTLTTAIDVEAV